MYLYCAVPYPNEALLRYALHQWAVSYISRHSLIKIILCSVIIVKYTSLHKLTMKANAINGAGRLVYIKCAACIIYSKVDCFVCTYDIRGSGCMF